MTMELSPGARPPLFSFRAKALLFALIALLYAYALVTNEAFLFDRADPEWAHIAPFQMWLWPHALAAAFALFLGPFQFSERLRRKYVMVHKTFGYLYIAGCYIGAPLGIYIQWFKERLGDTRGFTFAAAADAALWILATSMALWFIRSGRMQQHRQWMIRSFACAIIFLEVRAITTFFQIPVAQIETVVWCCVAAAYPLADLVLQIDELRRTRARPARSGA